MSESKAYQLSQSEALLVYATLQSVVEQIMPMRHTEPDVLPVVASYNEVLDTLKRQGLEPV